jgi:hypothetical protein
MLKIRIKDLLSLSDNDGMTLENGERITYKSGYQVATHGIETKNPRFALKTIKAWNGNAGVWYSKKIFYIDYSIHVETLEDALRIGREHNQQSILDWSTMELIWLS